MAAPSLSMQVNGLLQVSGDNFNTYVQTADSVAQLAAFVGAVGMGVYLKGFTTPGDGGQGNFYWNSTGTGPNDGGVTNIVPSGSTVGCWTRILATGIGNGTVTSLSVVTANGVSGTVANPTTIPAITLVLGAITPSSVTASGAVSGSNLMGTNTGDQTITLTGQVTGAGTGSFATTLASNTVTSANFRQSAAHSVVGNATNATGNVTDISGTANQVLTVNAAGNTVAFQNTLLTMGVVTDSGSTSYGNIITYNAGPYTLSNNTSINNWTGFEAQMPVASGSANLGLSVGFKAIGHSLSGNTSATAGIGTWVTPASFSGNASISNYYGIQLSATSVSSATVSFGSDYKSLATMVSLSNGAVVTNSYGYQVTMPTLAGTSVLSNAYGVRVDSPTVPGTATLTSAYGLYIDNMGAAGIATSKAINIQAQSGSTTNWDLFIADGFYVKSDGTVTHGNAALVTTATTGLLWLESCPGAPTGAAAAPYTLAAAMVYDSTNNKIYVRCNGTWRSTAALT